MKKKTLLGLVSLGAVALVGASVLAGCGAENVNSTVESAQSTIESAIINAEVGSGKEVLLAAVASQNALTEYKANIITTHNSTSESSEASVSLGTVSNVEATIANANNATPDVLIKENVTVAQNDEQINQSSTELYQLNGGADVYTGYQNEQGELEFVYSNDSAPIKAAVQMALLSANNFEPVADLFVDEGTETVDSVEYKKISADVSVQDMERLYSVGIVDGIDTVDIASLNNSVKVTMLIDAETNLVHSILMDTTDLVNEITQQVLAQNPDVAENGITTTVSANVVEATYSYDLENGYKIAAPTENVIIEDAVNVDVEAAPEEPTTEEATAE